MVGTFVEDIKGKFREGDFVWSIIVVCGVVFVLQHTISLIGLSIDNATLTDIATPFFALPLSLTVLDGSSRPGHFQGVCTVVERLLEIVAPDHLMLGQKDYQQCLVITRLLALMGNAGNGIQIHICPTLREENGLAMSSRNMRLNMADREEAALIHQCLLQIRNELEAGKLNNIKQKITAILISQGFRPDYVELANARNLTLTEVWDGKEELVALIAAFLSEVRLIDNMLIQKATE